MFSEIPIVAFVPVADRSRALGFYQETLGLRLKQEEPFALLFDAGGVALRVVPVPDHRPSEHAVLGWEVQDIAATVAGLLERGVSMERYNFFEQDELGVWAAPDGRVKLAWFKDSEGNVLSVSEHRER